MENLMQRFESKTVVVTGGGGGIGGATCRRFAREGAKVAVYDMNLEAAERVASGIREEGGQAQAFRCDITDRASVDKAVEATQQSLGPIDVLVNNAGWDVFKPFTKTEPAQWDKLIAINLTGALHMHHAVLPGMAARKAGRIVNIASDAARVGSSGEAVYAACKGGLVAFCHRKKGTSVPRPLPANMRATASRSTWCAPGRPFYEVRNGVAWITINRPDKMNSFRGQTCDGITEAVEPAAKFSPEVLSP
jgi:NAD(P)-dependent dehydrogenase (short-subunit alcohol dehydrogenase family)